MEFTKKEQKLLSDGLLALIDNAGKAKKLCSDLGVIEKLDAYIAGVQALNSKICTEMDCGE